MWQRVDSLRSAQGLGWRRGAGEPRTRHFWRRSARVRTSGPRGPRPPRLCAAGRRRPRLRPGVAKARPPSLLLPGSWARLDLPGALRAGAAVGEGSGPPATGAAAGPRPGPSEAEPRPAEEDAAETRPEERRVGRDAQKVAEVRPDPVGRRDPLRAPLRAEAGGRCLDATPPPASGARPSFPAALGPGPPGADLSPWSLPLPPVRAPGTSQGDVCQTSLLPRVPLPYLARKVKSSAPTWSTFDTPGPYVELGVSRVLRVSDVVDDLSHVCPPDEERVPDRDGVSDREHVHYPEPCVAPRRKGSRRTWVSGKTTSTGDPRVASIKRGTP